jgi:hydrogenase expression/formation protein HypC
MCVAVPGKVLEIEGGGISSRLMGKVDFAGTVKEICLSYIPGVAVGDYVLVHAGFALSKLEEGEADELLADLEAVENAGRACTP